MTFIWIAVLLVVPIVAVIILLNRLHKRQQEKAHKRNKAYLHQVLQQTGTVASCQKQLAHQLVILDDVNGRLLVVHHVNHTYSHTLYPLEDIKGLEVVHVKEIIPADQSNSRSESFTRHIGLEIASGNGTGSKQLLVFYDHIEHSLFLMQEMEKKAKELKEKIKESKTKKQVLI